MKRADFERLRISRMYRRAVELHFFKAIYSLQNISHKHGKQEEEKQGRNLGYAPEIRVKLKGIELIEKDLMQSTKYE